MVRKSTDTGRHPPDTIPGNTAPHTGEETPGDYMTAALSWNTSPCADHIALVPLPRGAPAWRGSCRASPDAPWALLWGTWRLWVTEETRLSGRAHPLRC